MKKTITVALSVLALGLMPVAGRAGLTDKERALWGASAQAPTTFAVPPGQEDAVMAKAQALIEAWRGMDQYMWPMPIHTHTVHLIQTDEPVASQEFGFRVTETETASGAVITVDTSAYEGRVFEASRQRRDANKRAHLLAYLLEQSFGVPSAPPVAAPASAPAPPPEFEPALRRLRGQLAVGQYDAALSTLDGLRATVADRAKASPTSSSHP